MVNSNFFVDGGTVQAQEGAIYLRRGADDELLELCRAGTFVYVLTARQMGKSSLMVNTADRLAEDGIKSAEIDLNRIGVKVTKEEWYLGILFEINVQLGLKQDVIMWWRAPERQGLSTAQRLLLFFEQVVLTTVSEPVVIFVDEIETTLRLDFTDDFFAAVRSIHNARSRQQFERLTFVLIGVATPDSLIRDQQLTPFNVGRGVNLSDFTFEEAMPLAAGFGLIDEDARRVLGRVLYWSGGHPYLTQRLCRSIAEEGRSAWSENEVDEIVTRVFFGDKSYEDTNLRFIREMLLTSELDREEVLSTYRAVLRERRLVPDEEQALVKSHLKLSGVILRKGEALCVRNPIYQQVFDEQWVTKHYPINWTKRLTKIAAGIIFVLLFLSVPLAVVAWKLKGDAEENLKKANALSTQLQRALESEKSAKADLQAALSRESAAKGTAEKSREEAEKQRETAEQQRSLAQKQSKEADRQRQIAEAQEKEAQEQKQLAEEQRQGAQRQRAVAEGQRLEAEKQKKVAEAQRQMAMARQAELQADRAMTEGNFPSAQALYAKALSLDDTLETKGRYLEAKTKAFLNPVWKSSFKYLGGKFALSPDGKNVATLVENDEIAISDIHTGEVVAKLKGHEDEVTMLLFKPDGQHIASSSADGTIRVWDIKTSREIHKFQYGNVDLDSKDIDCCPANVILLAYSSDGQRLATCDSDDVITIRDAETGQVINTLVSSLPEVSSLVFSPKGDLAAGSIIGGIVIWKANDYKTVQLIEHGSAVIDIGFSSDGKLVAAGETTIKIWDLEMHRSAKPLLTINAKKVQSIACSSKEEMLAAGMEDGTVRLISIRDGKNVLEFNSYLPGLDWVGFGSDGTIIVLEEGEPIQRWETKNPRQTLSLWSEQDPVFDISFSHDTRLAASISGDGVVRIWELSSAKIVQESNIHNRIVRAVYRQSGLLYLPALRILFTPNDKSVLVAGLGTKVLMIDIYTGEVSEAFSSSPTTNGDTTFITDAAYSPNGQWMALSNSEDDILIKNLNSPDEPPQVLNGHSGPVTGISFSPDSKYLSSSSMDQTIRIWEVTTGKNVRSFTNPWGFPFMSVAYSPDGLLLASGSMDQKIRIWDVRSGAEVLNYETFDSLPTSVSFSPDGVYLAWGSGSQNLVRILNVGSREELPPLHKDDGNVFKVVFSPDNKWLASGGEGMAAHLWNMDVIRSVYNAPATSLLKKAEDETGLFIKGTATNQFSQLDLYTTLGNATESAYQIIPLDERNVMKGASCTPLPIVATLNPFPLTFNQTAGTCKNYPPLDLRLANGGEYAANRIVWETGLSARAGDEIYALIYIDNGSANNMPPDLAIAKNIKVSTFVDSNVGTDHTVSVSFGGEHTNQVSKSLKVKTGPNDYLEVVPYSGALYDLHGKLIKQHLQIGNNIFPLEDLSPGFLTDKFVRFTMKVKMKGIQ